MLVAFLQFLFALIPMVLVQQAPYVCGIEGFQFYSNVSCNNVMLCANGGQKLFIGCTSDATCRLYNPVAVCIGQCCCTPPSTLSPILGTSTLPNPILQDSSHSSFSILGLVALMAFYLVL